MKNYQKIIIGATAVTLFAASVFLAIKAGENFALRIK